MAVFTTVPLEEAAALVARLGLGHIQRFEGIVSGIENTNYFCDTDAGSFVLTLFERLDTTQLPFYLYLMRHLADRGIALPGPKADAGGELLHHVCGKPAALVDRLRGRHELMPDAGHCAQVGAALARMHLAGRDYPRQQPNLRGVAWWAETVPVVAPFVEPAQRELIQDELAFQQALAASNCCHGLPVGPIHADLFRDNVMFEAGELTGFLDFYFAACDHFVYDLAICLNDWCIDLSSGRLDEDRADAFVGAYDSVRRLESAELRLLPAMMRAGALRFWVSRLWDLHVPREAAMLKPHDPGHFERVLRARIAAPWHYLRT